MEETGLAKPEAGSGRDTESQLMPKLCSIFQGFCNANSLNKPFSVSYQSVDLPIKQFTRSMLRAGDLEVEYRPGGPIRRNSWAHMEPNVLSMCLDRQLLSFQSNGLDGRRLFYGPGIKGPGSELIGREVAFSYPVDFIDFTRR